MGFELSTEGSSADHLRKITRLAGGDSNALIGVLGATTGGGSAGAGCILSDGCDAMDLRMRGNSPSTDNQQFWSPP